MPVTPKKAYTSPSLEPLDSAEKVLAWVASRGTREQRENAAKLARELDRAQSRTPQAARPRTGLG